MLTFNKDESIHSFLTRALMSRYGLGVNIDFTGIVSDSGVVRCVPKVQLQYSDYFSEFSSGFIGQVLLNQMPFTVWSQELVATLDDAIFFGGDAQNFDKISSFRTQLRYCPSCFREQISLTGYSHFKTDWLYSIDCKKHEQPLCEVRQIYTNCCYRNTNLKDDLSASLTGICPHCLTGDWQFYSPVRVRKDYAHNYYLLPSRFELAQLIAFNWNS